MNKQNSSFSLRGILILLTVGVWLIVLQNAGIIPSKQKVYVKGGYLDADVTGSVEVSGSVDVSGSVGIDNTVDVNINEILGRPAGCSTSYVIDGKEYQSLHVSFR